MIKLTKNAIGYKVMLSCKGAITEAGAWMTNGSWAIKRDMIDGGGVMSTPAAIAAVLKLKEGTSVDAAPNVDALLSGYNPVALRHFVYTGWLKQIAGRQQKPEIAYCYEAANGDQLFLAQKYVDMMSPMFSGECYAVSNSTQVYPAVFPVVEDVAAILMPIRSTSFEADKAERAAARAADAAALAVKATVKE